MPKKTKTKSDETMIFNYDTLSHSDEPFITDISNIENLDKDITTHKKTNQSAIIFRPKNEIETSMMSSYYPKRNRTFNLSQTTEKKRVGNAMERWQKTKQNMEDEKIITGYNSMQYARRIFSKHYDGNFTDKQKSWISQSKGYWEWLKQQRTTSNGVVMSIADYKKQHNLSVIALREKYIKALLEGNFEPSKPNDFDKKILASVRKYKQKNIHNQLVNGIDIIQLLNTTSLDNSQSKNL